MPLDVSSVIPINRAQGEPTGSVVTISGRPSHIGEEDGCWEMVLDMLNTKAISGLDSIGGLSEQEYTIKFSCKSSIAGVSEIY